MEERGAALGASFFFVADLVVLPSVVVPLPLPEPLVVPLPLAVVPLPLALPLPLSVPPVDDSVVANSAGLLKSRTLLRM